VGWQVNPTLWAKQISELSPGQSTLGLDALLYFDHLWPYTGVATEKRGTPAVVNPQNSAATRFPYYESRGAADSQNPGLAQLIMGQSNEQESASHAQVSRAYYSLTRLNSKVILVGGHNGTGPASQIMTMIQ